jgi:hypothetical protein
MVVEKWVEDIEMLRMKFQEELERWEILANVMGGDQMRDLGITGRKSLNGSERNMA